MGYSVAMDYIKVLKSERSIHLRHVEALDKAIKLLEELDGVAVPVPAATRKKKVACPDCGKQITPGPGMAAHRKSHGWRKGQSLTEPLTATFQHNVDRDPTRESSAVDT